MEIWTGSHLTRANYFKQRENHPKDGFSLYCRLFMLRAHESPNIQFRLHTVSPSRAKTSKMKG